LSGQIQIAYLYGAAKTRETYRGSYKALYIGLAVVTAKALSL